MQVPPTRNQQDLRFHSTNRVEILLPDGVDTEQILSARNGAWVSSSSKPAAPLNASHGSSERDRQRLMRPQSSFLPRSSKATRFTTSDTFFDDPEEQFSISRPFSRSQSPSGDRQPLASSLPPQPSPAILKMKVNAAVKDAEALEYMRKYTMSPYAAKSAKSGVRKAHVPMRPASAVSMYSTTTSTQLPAPPTSLMMSYDQTRPISAASKSAAEIHAIKLWKLMEKQDRRKLNDSRPGSPVLEGRAAMHSVLVPSTTAIDSPLSIKLMADLRDMGVSKETAALVGEAVASNPTAGHNLNYRDVRSANSSLRPNRIIASASTVTSGTGVSRIYHNDPGSSDPTVAWPKPEPFHNHNGPQSKNRPTGAHSAGFYANHHHTKFRAAIGVQQANRSNAAMVPSMDFDSFDEDFMAPIIHAGRPTTAPPRNTTVSPPRNSVNPGSRNSAFQDSQSGRKNIYINETAVTDEQLCILTDPECTPEEVVEALSKLIALAIDYETLAATTLFDRGGVTIILYVMNRLPEFPDVQTKACRLLEIMASKNPLTLTCLFKQNGILPILAAVQTIARTTNELQQRVTAINERMQNNPGPQRIQPKRNWGHRPGSTTSHPAFSQATGSNDHMNSCQPAIEFPSNVSIADAVSPQISVQVTSSDSNEKLNVRPPNFQRSLSIAPAVIINSRVDNLEAEPLTTSILQKYYDPRFMVQLDKMDKTARSEIVKHLLSLFKKVDKILLMGGLISLEMDTEYALDQIIYEAENLVSAELLLLYLVDPATGDFYAADSDPYMDPKEKELIKERKYPMGMGIVGWVGSTLETVNLKDASRHERFEHDIDIRGMNVIANSMLCVPLASKDGVLKGVMAAINKTGPNGNTIVFNQEDEFLLKTLGKLAGMLIGNAQTYNRLKKTQEKVEVLLETTRSLGSTLELDLLVKRIMDAAKDLLMADRCTLFLSDAKAKQLKAHIQGRDSIEEIRIPMNSGIAGFAFTSGESVNIADAYKDSRFNPDVDKKTGYITRNMLCIPIRNISGQSIGVTQMINKKVGAFEADDEKLLISFSAQAAVAIENSNLFKKTEDMLRETSNMKNYLSMILQSITNVVITLDKNGYLSHINHPQKMDLDDSAVEALKKQHFEVWLGAENATLLSDIKRAFSGNSDSSTIFAQDYELSINNKIKNVNYTIVQMAEGSTNNNDTSGVGGNGGGGGITGLSHGVVIVLEDISSEKRALMTLGRYMSPALAKQVMAEDGGQLGGKRKKVAILFSDIRSFTTISESMEPHMVVEMLNHHFTDAVNAIVAEQGILDKYIGDAVMAVFGVPFVNPDDSIHACSAALRMKESLQVYNETVRIPNGQDPIKMGIGVNTGMVLSGNIGSLKRMEFSCIGDAVNLSSRIEGMTKMYGVTILITEHTVNEIGDNFIIREIDSVVVKGKSNKVSIYELLGRKGDELSASMAATLEYFEFGLKVFRERAFDQAIECFSKALRSTKDDGPSLALLERAMMYRIEPPPDDWNGVYHADSK
ncbi:hypothetical protein HDU77_003133 [Chytriomyces hyalinus]|nr:hypothetical protein HDU77_003133 [Chytriomyces hyalinus]